MVGYTYNPWLTRTWQTSFQETEKPALPPPSPLALGAPSFLLCPSTPHPALSMPGHLSTAMETAREELGSSGKTVVSKVGEDAERSGPDGARPQRQLLGRARWMPPLFSLMCWECSSSIYFHSLGLYFFIFLRYGISVRETKKAAFFHLCVCVNWVKLQWPHIPTQPWSIA